MTKAELLSYIQYRLEDETETIWSESHIEDIIDQATEHFSRETELLEDFRSIRYPFQYKYSCTYEWEQKEHSNEYTLKILSLTQNPYEMSCTYSWEIEAQYGSSDSSRHEESYVGTYTWEFIDHGTGQIPRCELPMNCIRPLRMYYNEKEIFDTSKLALDSYDHKWSGRVGEVVFFTQDAQGPRGFAIFKSDADKGRWGHLGSKYGVIREVTSSDYTYSLDGTYGVIRTISGDDKTYLGRGRLFETDPPYGTVRDWSDPVSNIEIVFIKQAEELEFPVFCHKYIGWACLAHLLSEDTEGKNPVKAKHFAGRYQSAIGLVKVLKSQAKGSFVSRTLGQPAKIHVLGEGV